MKPPDNVSPGALLQRLLDSPRPSETVPFPRKDEDGDPLFDLKVWVLTSKEHSDCCAKAETFTAKLFKADTPTLRQSQGWKEVYEDAKICEVLAAACRNPEDLMQPVFRTADDIRNNMGTDEIAMLFSAYQYVQHRFGPSFVELTNEDLDVWIEKLTAGVSVYPLLGCPPGMLVTLALSLAYRARTSLTGSGSYSSQPGSGPTSTSE